MIGQQVCANKTSTYYVDSLTSPSSVYLTRRISHLPRRNIILIGVAVLLFASIVFIALPVSCCCARKYKVWFWKEHTLSNDSSDKLKQQSLPGTP